MCLSGCGSTTQIVTQTRDVVVLPPAIYLTRCEMPFDSPPLTRNEAVERDLIWKVAVEKCGRKIEKLNVWYADKAAD